MKIIENSDIVNWGNYPEYICACVVQTTEDLGTKNGFICPSGEEIIWLSTKIPQKVGNEFKFEGAELHVLCGIGFNNGDLNSTFPMEIKELHLKPSKFINNGEKECSDIYARYSAFMRGNLRMMCSG
ncbi:hypothetical protein HCY66_06855 [Acinetobacter radioresistens]|uniref:hypothetical protein n=1 Tax=Acinetobacter radioresistens TaxID=40216 RepID=UPI0020032321|nr:hypothetical protein [Acinetobacter radioresistens]MCK4089804.1 hypothetical protein [Acinetobacter radioresistens]